MLTENSSLFRLLYEKNDEQVKLWNSLSREQQQMQIKGIESIAGKLSKSQEVTQERIFVFSGSKLFYKKRRTNGRSSVVKASFDLEWTLAEFSHLSEKQQGEEMTDYGDFRFKIRLRKNSKFSNIFLKSHSDLDLWRTQLSSSGVFFCDFNKKYEIIKFLDESTYGYVTFQKFLNVLR